jgi:hypothetical protein
MHTMSYGKERPIASGGSSSTRGATTASGAHIAATPIAATTIGWLLLQLA